MRDEKVLIDGGLSWQVDKLLEKHPIENIKEWKIDGTSNRYPMIVSIVDVVVDVAVAVGSVIYMMILKEFCIGKIQIQKEIIIVERVLKEKR